MNRINWSAPVPRAECGLGVNYVTYAAGRVGASVNRWGGLHQIAYYGLAPETAPPVYFEADAVSSYARLFRPQLWVGERLYNLELGQTDHFPFGYASTFEIAECAVKVRHHLTLLNDALLFTLEVVGNPRELDLKLQWEHHQYTQKPSYGGLVRTWTDWQENAGLQALTVSTHERASEEAWQTELDKTRAKPGEVGFAILTPGLREGQTQIAFFGSSTLQTKTVKGRMLICGAPFQAGTQAAALLFASNPNELAERIGEIHPILPTAATNKESEFLKRLESAPALEGANPTLASYFANVPGIVETLMVEDKPGAMRASFMHYWVWGWDTVMGFEAYLVAGNRQFVRDALLFYRDSADENSGLGHQFTRDLRVRLPQAFSAQCLYLIMLYGYASYGDDADLVREVYPFARHIFERACQNLNEVGLGTGPALWPDYPVYAGHTGRDCSVFNNSILYQGARCMETLAHLCDDRATAQRARQVSRGLEERFMPTFWDEEKAYFVDSVDALTLEQRKSYPSHALLWQSAFCSDLVAEKLPQCAAFIRENHATPRGFLTYPRWDSSFNGDHNQLGQTWPITDVFDTICLAVASDQGALEQWIEKVVWFWEQLTVPEAYSVQTLNDSGTPDAPGGKQAFSAKSWYLAIVQSLVGVSIDIGGLTLGAGLCDALKIQRFHFKNQQIEIATQGAGHYPASLLVDGKPVQGSCKVPRNLLESGADHRVVFHRTPDAPAHPVILSLHGASVESVEVAPSQLRAQVAGWHDVWLRFCAPAVPQICLEGQVFDCQYDAATHEGKVLLPLRESRPMKLEISSE